jgi:hypothetical protein
MAVKKGNTNTAKAKRKAATATAEKAGESRKVRKVKALILDMAKPYKGKPAELANFYAAIENLFLDAMKKNREKREREAA